MARITRWTSPLGALLAAALLLGAQPVRAETSESLGQRATDAFNDAVLAGRAEHYQAACRGFNSAAGLYKIAIYALMAEPMQTDEERDYVKRQANALQDRVDTAKEYAKVVCPLSDGPSGDDTISTSSTGNANSATKEELQRTETAAKNQYREAVRLYEAHDFSGACASARQSAASFARIVAALKAQPSMESAFANPAQLYANAAQTAEDRDTFYCKG